MEDYSQKVLDALSYLFPYFNNTISTTKSNFEMNTLKTNKNIAHPDMFDRYFDLKVVISELSTGDVYEIIENLHGKELKQYIIKKDNENYFDSIMDNIEDNISKLDTIRVHLLIDALVNVGNELGKNVELGFLVQHPISRTIAVILNLLQKVPVDKRFNTIKDLIEKSNVIKDEDNLNYCSLQLISIVVNRIESAYGKIKGVRENIRYQLIEEEELKKIESLYCNKVKEAIAQYNLLELDNWKRIFFLFNYLEREYMTNYLKEKFKEKHNILLFLPLNIMIYEGVDDKIIYEINIYSEELLNSVQITSAINCEIENGKILNQSEEILNVSAVFYQKYVMHNDSKNISQEEVNKTINDWRKEINKN